MTTRTTGPAVRALAASGIPLGAGASLATAALLARLGATIAAGLSPATTIDTLVVLAVTLAGAAVATWAGLHLALATLCLLGAVFGSRWRAGERLVAAHGPTLVRRGLAAALGASLGLSGLAAASAAPGLPEPTPTTASGGVPELGWRPTLDLTPVLDLTLVTDTDVTEEKVTGTLAPTPTTASNELPELGWKPTPDLTPVSDTDGTEEEVAGTEPDAGPETDEPEEDAGSDRGTETGEDTAPDGGAGPEDDTAPEKDAAPEKGTELPNDTGPETDTESDRDTGSGESPEPGQGEGPERYLVTAGDSLWSITDRLLGGATSTHVAEAWPELYEANRDVVGADPDLIHPGQELVVPTLLKELS